MKKHLFLSLFIILISSVQAQKSLDSLSLVSPIGHINWINCSAIRNNILYTGSQDKTLKIWDLISKKELKSFNPSNDVVANLDVTRDGQFFLSVHQKDYFVIQNIKNDLDKKIIQLNKNEICEEGFFAAKDSLIIIPIYNFDLTKSLLVYNFHSKQLLQKVGTTLFNENLIFSKDKLRWFYLIDPNTISSNRFDKGKIITEIIKFDNQISNFTLDNIEQELIVLNQNNIVYINLYNPAKRITQKRPTFTTEIELFIPLVNRDFLFVTDKHNLLHYKLQNQELIDLGNLGKDKVLYSKNTNDSTLLILCDYLFKFYPNKGQLEEIFSTKEFLGKVNLNCSENFISVEGPSIAIFNRNHLSDSSIQFLSPGNVKQNIQVSQNGEFIAILNDVNKLEVFSMRDFSMYDQIQVSGSIKEFYISNTGRTFILTYDNRMLEYNSNVKLVKEINFELKDYVRTFTYLDSLNQLWLITNSHKLVKFCLNDLKIQSQITLNYPIKDFTEFSRFLNSYFEVNSDNYSFCELGYGELNKKLSRKKLNCSTAVSEGAFKYGLSEDGKYISYVDENIENLVIIDVKTSKVIRKVNISHFDEIIDVSISSRLNQLCMGTFDDSVYCFNLFTDDNSIVTSREIYSVNDLQVNEVKNLLLCTSDNGCFYLNKLDEISPIYSMFSLKDGGYLVKLTNSPYYMCSKDASKMLHYVTPSLKVIGFEQLDPVYNRPDIVLDSIGKYFGGADKELVSNYRESWVKRIDRLGLDKEKLGKGDIAVPDAEIVDADKIAYENKEGKLVINVKANDPKYTLRRFNVYVNEVPLYGSAGISIAQLKKQQWDTTLSVPLSLGENKIQVSVMNELGLENFKYPTYVNYTPEKNKEIFAKTHYIGIGVNEFKEAGHNLNYCVKDVRDLAKAFSAENTQIDTLLFTDEQVTRENILALKDYLNKTNVNDKVIISCSSHGLLDDSLNFYLATHDVDFDKPKAHGLKYEELEGLLDGIPARQKLLLLDACNSGENDKTEVLKKELEEKKTRMDSTEVLAARGAIIKLEQENKSNFKKLNELFVNVRNNTGSVIISAAGGQESALEAIEVNGQKIENGAFTYSVLEYLKANEGETDALTVNKLKQYVEQRVEEITNGKQKPTSRQETMEVDWRVR
jgi:WD40 repeat protein